MHQLCYILSILHKKSCKSNLLDTELLRIYLFNVILERVVLTKCRIYFSYAYGVAFGHFDNHQRYSPLSLLKIQYNIYVIYVSIYYISLSIYLRGLIDMDARAREIHLPFF